MRPKLTLITPGPQDLRNVVFLGDARFNSLEYKLVEKSRLSLVDQANKICEQTCGCPVSQYKTGSCTSNKGKGPCMFVVVRRTPQEKGIQKLALKARYPLTRFE